MKTTPYLATWITPEDLHWFNEGTHFRLHEKLGAHLSTQPGTTGAWFVLWRPDADRVSVIGDFNDWSPWTNPLEPLGESGLWAGFVPGVRQGTIYKYQIAYRAPEGIFDETDPGAFLQEPLERGVSVVWNLDYNWRDREWMDTRKPRFALDHPVSIYELDPASWRRAPKQGHRPLTALELAPELAEYVQALGFTHVQLLGATGTSPVDPFGYGSFGHSAPASYLGRPQDVMWLIDTLHQHGIGVILDWTPWRPPGRERESGGASPARRRTGAEIGRPEVRSLLFSNSFFWLDKYHLDGLHLGDLDALLRVEASAGSPTGEPHRENQRPNVEGVHFLQRLNEAVYRSFPDVQTIGQDASDWPMASRPTYAGGLGFGYKWDQNATAATLSYFDQDPIHRKHHHGKLRLPGSISYSENWALPLAHEEVMPGHRSLLARMPGDDWQKFANLRLLLAYLYCQPGKKLVFMGSEFGQWDAWNPWGSLDWSLIPLDPRRRQLQRWLTDLNHFYCREPALHRTDNRPEGFQCIDGSASELSVLVCSRQNPPTNECILAVFNFTPATHHNHRVGAPGGGYWREALNSDGVEFGGSGQGNLGGVAPAPFGWQGQSHSLFITLPPLGAVFFKREP